ncbi:right-handed parallel beta-helix repeat-containing protein [Aeoliella sp. SH292]|uniref:right-handed parallel beta-helix repeat-containing protein n=1 Tax=Aeoliella sp. SH292 TaxID=3454464 RepID=UPI003F9BC6F5
MVRFASLVALALLVSSAIGRDLVVDPLGNDANAGTAASPWRTLQHAANEVAAGDRVTVRAGSYAGFNLTTSGSAEAPIEFVGSPGAIISSTNPQTNDGINLEGASHIVIDGFKVGGMPRAGVRTVGPWVNGQQAFAQFVTIRNVTSHDNGKWGILTGFVNDLLIENNRTSGSIDEHGIYVSNSGDRPVIRNNEIWGNRANGIHINADKFSGLDGVIEEAVVSGNVIYDNGLGGGSGINLDGVRDSLIENNLIYNSHSSGISLYQIDGAGPSTGNVIIGNTVVQASDGRWALNMKNGAANTTVANNIFLSNHSFRGAIDASPDSLVGLVSDHNVLIPRFTTTNGASVSTLAQWQASTGQDLHSIVAASAELFVAPAQGDYRLRGDSPARDEGWGAHSPPADFLGVPRPLGAGVDIGAFEWRPDGDFNGDGTVNLADYTVWRDSLGASGLRRYAGADATGDGNVTAEDYAVWKTNFAGENEATSATGTNAVPEPSAWLLLAGAVAVLSRYVDRRPRRA